MNRLGTAILVVMSLALAAVVGLELRPSQMTRGVASAPSRSIPAASSQSVATTTNNDRAGLEALLARPLFSPTRRPPTQAAPVAGPAAAAPSLPRLAGIVIIGGQKSVIFASDGDRRPVTVAEGSDFNGFRVESIEAGNVTVSGSSGRQVLHPSFDPKAPLPAAASALPAPPPAPASPVNAFNGQRPPPGQPNVPPSGPISLPGLPGVTLNATPGIPGLTGPAAR